MHSDARANTRIVHTYQSANVVHPLMDLHHNNTVCAGCHALHEHILNTVWVTNSNTCNMQQSRRHTSCQVTDCPIKGVQSMQQQQASQNTFDPADMAAKLDDVTSTSCIAVSDVTE